MSPWEIVGWLVVVVVSLPLLFVGFWLAAILAGRVARYRAYLSSRNTPLREGQVWLQGTTLLTVEKEHADGHFTIRTGTHSCNMSWGETPKEWRERVRSRKLILMKELEKSR